MRPRPGAAQAQGATSRGMVFEALEGRQLFCLQHLIDAITAGQWIDPDRFTPGADSPAAIATASEPSRSASSQSTGLVSIAAEAVAANGLPLLNSVPGAPTAVYLDFDGYTTANQTSLAYDTDGNPAIFGATEQADIREAWRHVASYFAMFNTNVTTVQPSVPYSWSVITNSNTGVGYSYLQFNVASPGAYNPSGDTRTRQSGLAHEIGHNFGLQHQSDYDLLGEKIREYTNGFDNLHGPIMGVDYAQSIHKWFIGHPSDSPTRVQDDVQVIASKIRSYPNGGDGMRPDDVPNAIASAAVLTLQNGAYAASGIIERLADADAYSFASTGAQIRFDVTPPNPSMLDAKVEVYAADGSLLAAADGSTNDQHLTLSLPAGTYYAVVKSHGDYGDLGPYDLSIRSVGAEVTPPTYNSLPAPANVVLGRAASGTGLTVTWDPVDGATGYSIERSTDGASWTAAANPSAGTTTFADNGVTGGRRYFYRVSALDSTGRSEPSALGTIITRPSAVSSLTFTSWRPDSIILNWRDVSGDAGYRIERQTDATADTWVTVGTVGTNVPSYTAAGLTAGTSYRYRVVTLSAAGESAPVDVTGGTRLPAVTGVAFTGKLSNKMSLKWNALASAVNYRVQRSTNNIDWDTVSTQTGTTFDDATVQSLHEYYYRVVPLNGASQGLLGTTVFAATPAAPAQALPAAWTDRDVGSVGGSGATGFSSGTFTVVTSGDDIWDPSDSFHYTYQPLVGDVEIVARVFTQEPTDGWAKAGVMVRESLTAGSRHAMMVITPDNGSAFQYRTTTGGASANSNTAGAFAPYWVRLVRQGSTLIGYRSNNGTVWTEQGRATIPMAASAFIGLAVVCGDNGNLQTVSFTNVTVSNRAPTIATVAAAAPAPVTGTTASLTVLGADDHGETNLRYTWSTEQAPDGAAPPTFSASNTNAARNVVATFYKAGTYVLRVTATDSAGLAVTSSVTVQVVPSVATFAVTPATPRIGPGQALQFAAAMLDQFGLPVLPAPAVTWYADDGVIDASGLYTAPIALGQYQVAAEAPGYFKVVTVDVVDADFTAPTLVSAASSKVHGRRGTFDLPLSLADSAPTVEPRRGGASTLRFTFSESLVALDGTIDGTEFAINDAAFSSVTVDNSGGVYVMTLSLSGVRYGGWVTVTLKGLADLAGNALAGDRDLSVVSLFGDIDGNGVVSNLDVLLVRNAVFPSTSGAWNYLLDLDASGSINARDVLLSRGSIAR